MVDFKMVDGEPIQLTDAEQAAHDARQTAWDAGAQGRILSDLAAHRYAVQTGGTTVNGIAFLTDSDSQVALMGAMIIASANPAYTVNWKTPAGFFTLTATQVISIANTVAAFIQQCFSTEATLIANVAQYSDTPTIIAAFDAAMAA